jgi:dipeptidyl aminopeptidase/acylaminoacyl peptidase
MMRSTPEFLDALVRLPEMSGAKVSPDGAWAAWTWWNLHETLTVYAAPTDGSAAPVCLSAGDENVWLVSWTPDSSAVIVASDHGGDERATLFRVSLAAPGTMQPLTNPEPDDYLYGGMLHPNGRWLVYAANFDAETGASIEPHWIYRHDLDTGERLPLARPVRAMGADPLLSPNGAQVLYYRCDLHPAGRQVWLVGIDGAHDHEIVNVGADKKVTASWLRDGQHVLICAETETHNRIGIWSLADESLRWWIDEPTRNIEMAWMPANSDLAVIVESHEAQSQASLFDPFSGVEYRLPFFPGTIIPLAPAASGGWVGMVYHAQQPTDLARFEPYDLNPTAAISVARVWAQTTLTRDNLTPAEDFRWQADDGLDIQGWLYRGRGKIRGTILWVHGGPTYHSENMVNPQIQFFAAEGFNVLDPNYRGSTGFSRAFREAIKVEGWGGSEQDDIRAGIEALIARGIATPGKIGITGLSYGGYSSWCAITRQPVERIAAAAPVCGMTDLTVDYDTTRPDLRPYSEEMMGGSPTDIPDKFRERSPLYFVEQIRGRLLIVQGLQDPNVTPENVRTVEAALQAAGVPYDLLTFDDEGHGIYRVANQKVLNARLVAFFAAAFAG